MGVVGGLPEFLARISWHVTLKFGALSFYTFVSNNIYMYI